MQNLMKCRRFTLAPRIHAKYEAMLDGLAAQSPSDAVISFVVHKYGRHYAGDLSVTSSTNHFGVRAEAARLESLMKRILDEAYDDLRLWRRNRDLKEGES